MTLLVQVVKEPPRRGKNDNNSATDERTTRGNVLIRDVACRSSLGGVVADQYSSSSSKPPPLSFSSPSPSGAVKPSSVAYKISNIDLMQGISSLSCS